MGRIKHDAIICTARDIKYLRAAHKRATDIFGEMASEIVNGIINGQVSFFIAPDGSMEGWEESNACDERRLVFLEYLKEQNTFIDYVAVQFGGDDDQSEVYSGGYIEQD